MESIQFNVRFVPAGTGLSVWDDPHAEIVQRFVPRNRQERPTIGIVHLGPLRPTAAVLRNVVLALGEDVKAGRYGEFSLVVSSEDEATRNVISDIANAQNVAMFLCSSLDSLEEAKPVGGLTPRDRETMDLVLQAGGTVTATDFARQIGVEQTTAGNRLISLHKKGYLQRVQRPHPVGDLFVDPRSMRSDK